MVCWCGLLVWFVGGFVGALLVMLSLLCSPRCCALLVAVISSLLCSLRCCALLVAVLSSLLCSPRCCALLVAVLSSLLCSPCCCALLVAVLSLLLCSPRCCAFVASSRCCALLVMLSSLNLSTVSPKMFPGMQNGREPKWEGNKGANQKGSTKEKWKETLTTKSFPTHRRMTLQAYMR